MGDLGAPGAQRPRRWIAVGDSFTAGTGDDEGGWVRRTFAAIADRRGLTELDLRAVEGVVLAHVVDEQSRADDEAHIISVIAGANDIMRPHYDAEETVRLIDRLFTWAVDRADVVVTSTCPDFSVPRGRATARIGSRVAIINDLVWQWAARCDRIVVVDAFTLLDEPALWSSDRIHPSPDGHRLLAEHAGRLL